MTRLFLYVRFRNFDSVISSRAKLRVLKYLLSSGPLTSEREISRLVEISHMSVNRALRAFEEANLVSLRRIGNVNCWELNRLSYSYGAIRDLEKMAKNPPLKDLQRRILERFKGLTGTGAVSRLVVFGSVSRGN